MKTSFKYSQILGLFLGFLFLIPFGINAQSQDQEVLGRWNLTIQTANGNVPAWLEVKKSGFKTLTGYYVGAEGSARPISKIELSEVNKLYSFSIPPQWEKSDNDLSFEFMVTNDKINGTKTHEGTTLNWTGVRAPELVRKEAPKWGKPVNLLDKGLTKWNIPENNQFQMVDGVLVNKEKGGNLITKEKYNDFKVQLEFRYPEGSNSGVYLRGRYEVQIADNYGEKPSDIYIGGVYGYIAPTVNAARKAKEWQTMDITLVGRLVTIVLNGVEVVSNRPIPGITGGALDSDEGSPGPLMIQGDHGPVEFRKILITPSSN